MQSILGYLIALTLGLMGLAGMTAAQLRAQGGDAAAATAGQARDIIAAAQSYIASAPPGLPSTSASAPVFVTLPQLIPAPGNLFPGYAAATCDATYGCANPYRQHWRVQVVCPYSDCPYNAATSGSGPWRAFLMSFGGRPVPLSMTPVIANQVGANGGNTPADDAPAGVATSQSIEGAYAGWSYPLTGLYNPGPGRLYCRVN